jgi:xanthine dehydrogenase iron-sulfur cluster and FAD-binding subunit A
MPGNICRCGTYPNIVAAVEEVMSTRANSNHVVSSRGLAAGATSPRRGEIGSRLRDPGEGGPA